MVSRTPSEIRETQALPRHPGEDIDDEYREHDEEPQLLHASRHQFGGSSL